VRSKPDVPVRPGNEVERVGQGRAFQRYMRQSRQMREELSPSEAARRLGATTRSVQRWIALGRLPARRVGGRWRVASDALDAFVGRSLSAADPAAMLPLASPARTLIEMPAVAHPIRRLFIANRGEIARRIR
jgi:excisionase family DNA binding protein